MSTEAQLDCDEQCPRSSSEETSAASCPGAPPCDDLLPDRRLGLGGKGVRSTLAVDTVKQSDADRDAATEVATMKSGAEAADTGEALAEMVTWT